MSGLVRQVLWNGLTEQLEHIAFWRAPVDNDFGNKMPALAGVWRTAHVNRYVESVTIDEKNKKGLSVKVNWILSDIRVPYVMEYLIRDNGSVIVTGSIGLTGTKQMSVGCLYWIMTGKE